MSLLLLLFAFHFSQAQDLSLEEESGSQISADFFSESLKPQIVAIQTRPQPLQKEISGYFSYLPMDHFNHYFAVGGSYTHYFNDYLGWEVANFSYMQNNSTGLEDALRGRYGAVPETFDIIKYLVTTNVVYTPLFMKHLYREQEILWGDIALIGGVGVANLKDRGNVSAINMGAAVRFFTPGSVTYKLDLRQFFFMSSAVRPNLGITFAVSLNFDENATKGAQR
jgi:outer membrane beta-barrel protein